MGLDDIFFAKDIRNALLAANEASSATAAQAGALGQLCAFRAGYHAALSTVALAFGLSPSMFAAVRGAPLEVADKTVEMLRE